MPQDLTWFHKTPILKSHKRRFPSMRKIELEMVSAIRNKKNWGGRNTTVHWNHNEIHVRLHGNLIAVIIPSKSVTLSSCQWRSKITKSRLNAILDLYKLGRISQTDFVWYHGADLWEDNVTFEFLKCPYLN